MPKIIVSFTSYPARIKTVNKVLDCIIKQTILPDKIILYLSSGQFSGYGNLPDFSLYEKFGFELSWHEEDLGPHKKYYYAIQEYPDDIIITIDDDICYKDTMIEELIKYYEKYPKAVITRRAHLVTWTQDGNIAPYENWYFENFRYIKIPRMDLVSTGCAGVLYPPHIFKPELFNKSVFMEKAPYADDLWLKVMELYSEIPVVLTKEFFDDSGLEDYSENGLYHRRNFKGGNDSQLRALLEIYGKGCKENVLIKRLCSQGKLLLSDYEKVRKNDIYQAADEFFKIVDDQEKILIYGAGSIARKLYKVFRQTGRLKKIQAFIVKHVEENVEKLGQVGVRDYMNFVRSPEKIIIGLCEANQEEVCKDLIAQGVNEKRIIKLSPFISRIIGEVGS